MAPPVLCFTCGKVLSDKYEELQKIIREKKIKKGDHLDKEFEALGIKRYCCRMHLISYIDYTESVQ